MCWSKHETANVAYPQGRKICVHVETTGLKDNIQIVALGAVCGNRIFYVYIIPTIKIEPDATEANGLIIVDKGRTHINKNGEVRNGFELKYDDDRINIQALPHALAMARFGHFLKSIKDNTKDGKVTLVGHNIAAYSARMILRRLDLDHRDGYVFQDCLQRLRELKGNGCCDELEELNLKTLRKGLRGMRIYNVHVAVKKAMEIREIMNEFNARMDESKSKSFFIMHSGEMGNGSKWISGPEWLKPQKSL